MTQASLAALEALKQDLLQRNLSPLRCGDLGDAIDLILNLFDQAEYELTNLAACVDELAAHTGYQLEKKAEEADLG